MELFINHSKVDFTLESEKTASEIILSLETWGAEQGCVLTDIIVDGKSFDLPEQKELKTLPAASVKEIRVGLVPREEQVYDVISEMLDYAARIRDSFEHPEKNDAATTPDLLLAGINWMREALKSSAKVLRLEDGEARLMQQLKDFEIGLFQFKNTSAETKNSSPPAALAAQAESLLSELQTLFNRAYFLALRGQISRREEASSWKTVREEAARLLNLTTKLFREAALAIQKGRDRIAMPLLKDGTEGLEIAFSLFTGAARSAGLQALTIQGKDMTFETLCATVEKKLHEIETSFKNADYVFLSDLLEYELVELIPSLESCFDELAAKLLQGKPT